MDKQSFSKFQKQEIEKEKNIKKIQQEIKILEAQEELGELNQT